MANELSVNSLLTAFAVPEKSDWVKVARDETGLDDPLGQLGVRITKNLSLLPFYDHSDLSLLKHYDRYALSPVGAVSRNARYWENVPAVGVADPAAANKRALSHLAKGAQGIFFDGIEKPEVLLRDIDRSLCSTWFSIRKETDEKFAADLLNAGSATDNTNLLWEHTSTEPERFLIGSGPSRGLGIAVTSRTDVVEEIAAALTCAVRLLDRLTDKGFDPANVGRNICFSLSIGNDFFVSIAKFKVVRRLWYQVMRAYNVHDFRFDDPFLHARCAPPDTDRYEPRGALIAGTVAAIAAICGGCDALTVVAANGDDDLTARVARNISPILADEAHLDKVSDPLAGAYFLETLVDRLAAAAWTAFTNGPGVS